MPTKTPELLTFYTANPLTAGRSNSLAGLTITGPSTEGTPGQLRRAKGLHESCLGELRPAPGNTLLYAVAAIHSIVRFNDVRFFAAGTVLYRDGVAALTGLSGERLTLMRLPPGNSQRDQLFVAGGGLARKIDISGTVTQWGIDAPPDGLVAVLHTQDDVSVEAFEDATDWSVVGAGVVAADESTIVQEGTNSLKITVPVSTLATLSKAVTVDLSQFASDVSSEEDFIQMWIRVDGPRGFEYCALRFDIGSGDFASDYYQFKILPSSITINTEILTGIGNSSLVRGDEAGFLTQSDGSESGVSSGSTIGDTADVGTDPGGPSGTSDAPYASASWSRLRIRKKDFLRVGVNGNTWADVVAMQLMINVGDAGANILYFDDCKMIGGAGLHGNYKSLMTFDNTTTGARSNSNPTPVITLQNERQKIDYSAIPVSSDPQVNARTLWRTFGGGAAFFREHVIADNSTTTYRSMVADYVGLWSNAESDVLYLPELPTDNIPPEDGHIDFIYDQATVFWLSGIATQRGRVYFSPAGRPEAQRSYIQVCNDDTPLLRIVTYNRARYVFGEAKPYRIDGTEPYVPYPFDNIPGVLAAQARTVVVTPAGVIWQAKDGLRSFNGSTSDLLFYDRIGPIFRGEDREDFASFLGLCAGYARNQYFISNGTKSFSINLSTGYIRDLGQGFTAIYYEEDTKQLLAGTSSGLVVLEDVGVAPFVPCEWETSALFNNGTQEAYCLRLYIDAFTNGQAVTPTIIIDGAETALPPFVTASRTVIEYAVGRVYSSLAVRLNFTPTSEVKVYKIYVDSYTA